MTEQGRTAATARIHILCAVHNGGRYLAPFLDSLSAQHHRDWILWLVDDQSTDDSRAQLRAAASRDPRLHLLEGPATPLGALGAFAWLWARVPPEAEYIAFADQDDLWHPDKLERSLAALRAAEEGTTPVLVHTDLEVVGPNLEPMAPSFWRYAGIVPEPATVRRLVAQNVVTGCTVLVNRALYEAVGPIAAGATMHDAWVACVAAAVGRVVALHEPTVRYRQHAHNALGAREASSQLPWGGRLHRAWQALTGPNRVRPQLQATAVQAARLLERHGAQLRAEDRDFLRHYAQIPTMSWWKRKSAIARWHCHREHGWLRNAGIVWRG